MAPYLTLAFLLVATFSPTALRAETQNAAGGNFALSSSVGLAGQSTHAAALRSVAQASLSLADGHRLLIALAGVDAPSGTVAACDALALPHCGPARDAKPASPLPQWIARALPPRAP